MSSEQLVREKISQSLEDMSEGIIREIAPYDKVAKVDDVVPHDLLMLSEYANDIEEETRDLVLDAVVTLSRVWIHHLIVGHTPPFADLYPEKFQVLQEFRAWYRPRIITNTITPMNVRSIQEAKIRTERVLRQVMSEHQPSFEYDRGKKRFRMIFFSRRFMNDNTLSIVVDMGVKVRKCSYYLSLEKPHFIVDIGNFYGAAQSNFRYESESDVTDGAMNALKVIDSLMPFFMERVEECFERQ